MYKKETTLPSAPRLASPHPSLVMSQFQLFPPPSPEVRLNKNPFRRPNPNKTEGVLLQIIEDTQGSKTTMKIGRSTPEPSHGSTSPQSPNTQGRQAHKQRQHDSPSTTSTSTKAATSTASPQSSQSSMSPVPMRSMFPQFDPKLPLNQQHYCRQESHESRPSKATRKPEKLTLTTTSDIDQVLGPKTVPASVLDFPTDALEPEEIRYSSTSELGILWEAANGQRPPELCGTFSLRMMKYDHLNHRRYSISNASIEPARQRSLLGTHSSHSILSKHTRRTKSRSHGEIHPNQTAKSQS